MEPLTETKELVLMLAAALAGMTQAELPNFDRQHILAECRRIDAKVAADNAELDRLRARVGELEAALAKIADGCEGRSIQIARAAMKGGKP